MLVVVPEAVLDDKVILTLAVVPERVRSPEPVTDTQHVGKVEREKRRPRPGAGGRIGRPYVGGVESRAFRRVRIVRRVMVDGFRAGEDRRQVVAPGPKIVVEVDFVEPRPRELSDPRVDPVRREVLGRADRAFRPLAVLLEGQLLAVVEVAPRPLGVLNQIHPWDVPLLQRVD